MSSKNYGGTMLVIGKDGRWRVRIVTDNGLVVETKQAFPTVEEAKAYGNDWCREHGVRTQIAQCYMDTWIVHRVVKDKRCTDGQRWIAIGWVCHNNEAQARDEAHKAFRLFTQEELRLVLTKQGYGFLV